MTLDTPGINVKVPLYLREAYNNPTQECFAIPNPGFPIIMYPPLIPICYVRAGDKGTNHIDMKLVYDIFPTTLDQFYAPSAVGRGYSLAWGQSGDLKFPVMQDFDGDGLKNSANNGADPDDSLADADGDSLPDPYEIQVGSSPTLYDTDDDGLNDQQEVAFGTDPRQRDTDGDGLTDGQEVLHQDRFGQWVGGWEYVYDLSGGVPSSIWVTSDPIRYNSDGDELSDYQEWLYGLNPNAISDTSVLKMTSQVWEPNAPVALLRLEERAGANLFSDSSGRTNNGTCSGAGCPASGFEGRYTNSVVFDGVDDQIIIPNSASLTLDRVTVSMWIKPSANQPDWAPLLAKANPDSGWRNYALFLMPNTTRVHAYVDKAGCGSNAMIFSDTYLPLNAWSHVAMTYDGVDLRLYLNGQLDKSVYSPGGLCQMENDVRIGRFENGFSTYNGGMDEVLILPTALNDVQIGKLRDARYNPGGSQVLVTPNDPLTYQATLVNNLFGKSLVGLLSVDAPAGWGNGVTPNTFLLAPAQSQSIQGNLTVNPGAASGAYNLGLTAGSAVLTPPAIQVEQPGPAAFDAPCCAALRLKMDGDLADSSGNNRNGWMTGGWPATLYPTGMKNQAINLGSDPYYNYINLPNGVSNTSDFTFAAWVYWRGGGDWQRIFDFGQGSGNSILLTPRSSHGRMQFWLQHNGYENATDVGPALPENTWSHVAVTISGNRVRLYLNGGLVAEDYGYTNHEPWRISGSRNYLGKSQWSGDPLFNGLIDEVYVYHGAWDTGDIQRILRAGLTDVVNFNTTDAVLYLPFDRHYANYNSQNFGTGGYPVDRVATPPFAGGIARDAVNLDGTSYLRLPNAISNAVDFSFATWVYWRGGGDWQRIFDFGWDHNNFIMLSPRGSNNKMYVELKYRGNSQFVEAPPLPVNTWVHVAFVLQGDTGTIYVDGTPRGWSSQITHNPNNFFGDRNFLGLSQYWDDDPRLNGMLDEVYVFHRALQAWEITGLVNEANFSSATFSFDSAATRLNYTSSYQGNSTISLKGGASQRSGTLATEPGIGGGTALRFDGQTVYEVNGPAFNMNSTAFTYALWVRPDLDASGVRAIIGQPPIGRDWTDANSGIYLHMLDSRHLRFGWGGNGATRWDSGWINDALSPGNWNHVAVSFDAFEVRVYVNGSLLRRASPNRRPLPIPNLNLGDDNNCAQFSLKNVFTQEEGDYAGSGDPGASAEYRYDFVDDLNQLFRYYDTSADSGEWEPGWGPGNGEIFNDLNYTYCGGGATMYVIEVGDCSVCANTTMGTPLRYTVATPERLGYADWNKDYWFSSGNLRGWETGTNDGLVRYYSEIRNPVLPFKGALDDVRILRSVLSEEQVQKLYAARSVPYYYTLDDAPGAGLNNALFNFKNEGSIANPNVSGYCNPGYCPTSGLPGRVNQAVLFSPYKEILINNLDLPQGGAGVSMWVKPSSTSGKIAWLQAGGWWSWIYRVGNKICFWDYCPAVDSPSGVWTHLMVTYDTTGSNFYINGVFQLRTPGPWGGQNRYALTLGGWDFTGLIDDVRISYGNNDAAVRQMYGAAPILSLHMEDPLGSGSFSNVAGVSAFCAGGTCPDAGRKGKVGQAAGFNGTTDRISAGQNLDLANKSFTVAFWLRRDTLNTNQFVFGAGTTETNKGLHIGFRDNNAFTCAFFWNDLNTVPYADRGWNHYACTYDAATRQRAIYRNGQIVAQDIALANYQGAGNWMVGNLPFAHWPLNGAMDEVVVYQQALKTYEIEAMYNTQANWVEEKKNFDILVDADLPGSSLQNTLPLGINYYPNADTQLAVSALDSGSSVRLVELGVSRDNGAQIWTASQPCQEAGASDSSSPAWCAWFKPTQLGGEGIYQVQSRATDEVGNRENPAPVKTIVVDGSAPNYTVDQAAGSLQNLVRDPQNETQQLLILSGSVSDPAVFGLAGSGVNGLWVTLRNANGEIVNSAPYPAAIAGTAWTLAYPIEQAQAGGTFMVEISARDNVGNLRQGAAFSLVIDGAAPDIAMNEFANALPNQQSAMPFLTANKSLTGWYSERPLPGGAVYAYPFSDEIGSVRFENVVSKTSGEATCSGTACPAVVLNAQDGSGVSFDGVDDYLSLPAGAVNTTDFSFAAWVYWRGGNAWQRIFDFGGGQDSYLFLTPNDGFSTTFWIKTPGSNVQAMSGPGLPVNAWVHVALTIQSNTARLYVNGVQTAVNTNITYDPKQVGTSNIWLGRSQYPWDPYFNGILDNVALYKRALNSTEISVLAAPRAAGMNQWRMAYTPIWTDEQSGVNSPYAAPLVPGSLSMHLPLNETRDPARATSYRNLARLDAPATCSGSVCPDSGGFSPAGGAAIFDGKDDYLNLPAGQANTDNFSFSAWVYWNGGGTNQRIFSLGQNATNFMALTPSNGSKMVFSITRTSAQVLETSAMPVKQWTHVTVSLQGSEARIYLNGALAAANTAFTFKPRDVNGTNELAGPVAGGREPLLQWAAQRCAHLQPGSQRPGGAPALAWDPRFAFSAPG